MAAGVEVADEGAEAVLEIDLATVGASVVDDEDAEVFERTLQHASASLPGRAGGGELVERVDSVLDAEPVHAPEHLVQVERRRPGRGENVLERHRHGLKCIG